MKELLMQPRLDADLDLLTRAALEAGQLAMTFFRQSPQAWAKLGGSPVTEADMAVDTLLRTGLLAARPDYGWLSEETADDLSRRERQTIFVVDPIDGTRGFIEGDDRWCVSVAVVHEGRPVVGALYAPARQAIYTAVTGRGAWSGEARLAVSDRQAKGRPPRRPAGMAQKPRADGQWSQAAAACPVPCFPHRLGCHRQPRRGLRQPRRA
jgi:myo-inositol-1(or 4)-monophosphatase